jgi:hypothetical protein
LRTLSVGTHEVLKIENSHMKVKSNYYRLNLIKIWRNLKISYILTLFDHQWLKLTFKQQNMYIFGNSDQFASRKCTISVHWKKCMRRCSSCVADLLLPWKPTIAHSTDLWLVGFIIWHFDRKICQIQESLLQSNIVGTAVARLWYITVLWLFFLVLWNKSRYK